MKKRINKYSIQYGLVVYILCFAIESLVQWRFSYKFSLAFIVGLFTGLLNLTITDFNLSRLEFNMISKPKVYFTIAHIVKFIIYGIVMFFSAYFLGYLTSFTCAIGMLFHKLIIYYLYTYKESRDDRKRLVDALKMPNEIKQKLKYNDFFKVSDITEADRERLLQFLSEKEVEIVIKSLKEFELFIKGELEAIIDNDETVDV